MCTQSKHVIIHTQTVLSRTWLKVREGLKVKFQHTVQQDHRRMKREVIEHNLLHPCVCLHRFLHRCVQSMNFSDHSRSVLFFFTVSHLPLGLSTSLSGYHVFFYIYYTTLEYVCFIVHLSLCIIAYLFYKYHTDTQRHILLRCLCGVRVCLIV
jgi:hypothetical protein